jgi:hypothetical protein
MSIKLREFFSHSPWFLAVHTRKVLRGYLYYDILLHVLDSHARTTTTVTNIKGFVEDEVDDQGDGLHQEGTRVLPPSRRHRGRGTAKK